MTKAKSKILDYELNDDRLIVHVETKLSKDVLRYVNKGVELIIEIFGDFDLAE